MTDSKAGAVQIFLLPQLVEALSSAPSVIQTDLFAFISRFSANPEEIPYKERKSQEVPEGFRIFTLNSAWSVVVAEPAPDLKIIAQANWTKAAFEWAAEHEFVPNDEAKTGGYFRLCERPGAVKHEEEVPPPPPPLFADISDEELIAIGLPKSKLPLVRDLENKDDLEASRSEIPAETYQSLTWYVDGAEWSAVKREYAKLHHSAESQMGKIRLYLNPEQKKIVDGPWKGALLVQGGAGTGKSVVAMHRAKHLVELPDWKDDDRLLFVTATRNLAVDIEEQLQRLVRADRINTIEVTNLDGWVTAFLRRNGYKPAIIYPGKPIYDLAWKAATETLPEGVTEAEAREEFERHVLPNNIRIQKTYMKSDASTLTAEQREAIWPVFENFRRELFARGKVAAPDAYYAAIGLLTSSSTAEKAPYRAVIADEIQDFGPEGLKLLRALTPDHDKHPELRDVEGDLFLVGDSRERIYGRDVSFAACGINVKGGRSQFLTTSYRTTAEIAGAADYILNEGKESDKDKEREITLRHGPLPELYVGKEFTDEVSWIVRQIHHLIDTERDLALSSIVIAARTDSLLDDYQSALSKRGIKTLQISRNIPDDPNAAGVRSATLHRLKGLEFRAVFIVGADEGNIPDALTLNESPDPDDREDAARSERALFHVAATRAVDRLYVSCSDTPGEYLNELIQYEKDVKAKAKKTK